MEVVSWCDRRQIEKIELLIKNQLRRYETVLEEKVVKNSVGNVQGTKWIGKNTDKFSPYKKINEFKNSVNFQNEELCQIKIKIHQTRKGLVTMRYEYKAVILPK
jgi:hypothetical protein